MSISPRIDTLLAEAVARGDVPFVTGGIVTRDQRPRISCHGPVAPRSVYWIASMTKALTSVAAMQLVERGLIDLHAPIGTLLPELRSPQILTGFDAQGAPMLKPAQTPITLAHSLAHTSGFVEGGWNADILRYVAATGRAAPGSGRRAGLDMPLLFEPGTDWHYGIGHDWVGLASEAVSGQALDRYFAENLFAPLSMADTVHGLTPDQKRRLLPVHRRLPDGGLVAFDRPLPSPDREFLPGGGTMFSTAPDYLAFLGMILADGQSNGHSVLYPATIAAMTQSQTKGLGTMANLADTPTGRRAGSLACAGQHLPLG